jgi:hypothetical protein
MKCSRCRNDIAPRWGDNFHSVTLIHLLPLLAAPLPRLGATGGEGEFPFSGPVDAVNGLNLRDVGHTCLRQVSIAFP